MHQEQHPQPPVLWCGGCGRGGRAGGEGLPSLVGLLGGGGVPGKPAISQQLKPAHLPGLEHGLGLLPVLQPPLPQECHKFTRHLHPSHTWFQWVGGGGGGGGARPTPTGFFALAFDLVCSLFDKVRTIVPASSSSRYPDVGAMMKEVRCATHACQSHWQHLYQDHCLVKEQLLTQAIGISQ